MLSDVKVSSSVLSRFAPWSDVDEINRILLSYLEESRGRVLGDSRLARWRSHVADFALQGGKRIRPRLCLSSFRIIRRDNESPPSPIWKASVILELLHAFMLAHDDIIDSSVARRGQATLHERIRLDNQIQSHPDHRPPKIGSLKQSKDLALIGGDLLFALAMRLLSQSGLDHRSLHRALRIFSNLLIETGVGEALDVLFDNDTLDQLCESKIVDAYLHKTARYSISGPLVLGASLAGADRRTKRSLRQFGDFLGLGYQIRNDLETLALDPESDIGDHADLDQGKRTLIICKAFRKSSESARQQFREALNDPPGVAKRKRLLSLIQESAAIDDCREWLGRIREQAVETLDKSSLDSKQKHDYLTLPLLFSDFPFFPSGFATQS